MFRGISLFGLRREQLQTRRLRPTVKPWLEELTERILPSASTVDSQSMEQWNQLISTLQNDLSSIYKTIGQEITEEIASVEQQWDHLLGLDVPHAQNQPPSSGTQQPGSGSGSGSGATRTISNGPNQQLNNGTPKSGSGSGSGATTSRGNPSKHSPITGNDSGSLPVINLAGSADYYGSEAAASGSCGPSNVDIQVDISSPVNQTASVDYTTSDITATAGTDYASEDGVLTFTPGGQTYQTISIPILDDGGDEDVGSQSFGVSLSSPNNATIGPNQSTVVFIAEGLPQAPTDTLQWNPCMGNKASTASNWYDVTQGFQLQNGDLGPNASSPIVFDGTQNSTTSQNAPIIWDKSVTVASITLQNSYTAQMTLGFDSDVHLTSVGKIEEWSACQLNMDFTSVNDKLVVQSDTSALTNFNFSDQDGAFVIQGPAFVNMGASYSEQSAVKVEVESGATLNISGSGAGLKFVNGTALLPVDLVVYSGGALQLKGSNSGTLITTDGNNSILQNNGTVWFTATPSGTPMLKIPVLNTGVFNVDGGGDSQYQGGTLEINETSGRTANANFDMTGGQLNLFGEATLNLTNGYVQSGGMLATLDTLEETLKAGGALISGGKIVLDYDDNGPGFTPGKLSIICNTVNFSGGEYDPRIDGQNSGSCDLLEFTGNLNLQGATMVVTVENTFQPGIWTVVTYNTRTGTFNNPTLPNGMNIYYPANKVNLA